MRPEHRAQVEVIKRAKDNERIHPELRLLNSSQNGATLAGGKESRARQMNAMKAAGLRVGYPDLNLPVARGGYFGLYIELKVGDNQPSESQAFWLDALTEQGYLATACWGTDDAWDTIVEYLQMPKTGVIKLPE